MPTHETPQAPDNISLLHHRDALIIRRRWFSPKLAWPLLLFCLIWDGFMIVWFGIAIAHGEWIMALAGILHGGVGLGISYYVAALFLNHTDITITPEHLSICHAPLHWPGGKRLDSASLTQLFCKEGRGYTQNSRHVPLYEVFAADLADKHHKLLGALPTPEQARYIEQEIESVLGLENCAVKGEL